MSGRRWTTEQMVVDRILAERGFVASWGLWGGAEVEHPHWWSVGRGGIQIARGGFLVTEVCGAPAGLHPTLDSAIAAAMAEGH